MAPLGVDAPVAGALPPATRLHAIQSVVTSTATGTPLVTMS
jgi:hypothetical protein